MLAEREDGAGELSLNEQGAPQKPAEEEFQADAME